MKKTYRVTVAILIIGYLSLILFTSYHLIDAGGVEAFGFIGL